MNQTTKPSVTKAELAAFCERWKINELAAFGSVMREDFGSASDIDLLATFAEDAAWSVLDHMQMELELMEMFGREVDLIDRRALETHGRARHKVAILDSARLLYSAPEAGRVAGS